MSQTMKSTGSEKTAVLKSCLSPRVSQTSPDDLDASSRKSDVLPTKLSGSEKTVSLKSCLSPKLSPRAAPEDTALVSSMKSDLESPTRKKPLPKVVSFSELSQYFAPSHTVEEVWGIRADSCVVDMIPEDEEIDRKGITRVDFTSLDKTSVAAEVVPANQGEKAFSMDLVFQKLLDLQLSQAKGDLQDVNSSEIMKEKESVHMVGSDRDPVSIDTAVKLALEDNSANNSKNNSGNNTATNSNNNSAKIKDITFDGSADSSRESLESPLSPEEVSTTKTTVTVSNNSLPSNTTQLSSWNNKYGANKTTNNICSVVPNLFLHEALNKPQLPVDTTPMPITSAPTTSAQTISVPTTSVPTTSIPTVSSLPVNEVPTKTKKSVRMHFADDDDNDVLERRAPIIHQPTDPSFVSSSAAAVAPSPASSSSSSSYNSSKKASFQLSENHNNGGNGNQGQHQTKSGEQSMDNQWTNNGNLTKNTPTTSSSSTPKPVPLSATQFRRHEREHRHLVVAMDLARGLDSYNLTKLIQHVAILWFGIPLLCNVIVYGVIPYQYPHTSVPPETSRISVPLQLPSVQPSSSPSTHSVADESPTSSINISPSYMTATLSIQIPYIYTDPYDYGLPRSTNTGVDTGTRSSIESNNDDVSSSTKRIHTNMAHTTIPSTTETKTDDNIQQSNLFSQIESLIINQHKIFKNLVRKHQNLIPSILLIMASLATLSMECYSNIISEIEFSVILWEDTPVEYVKTGINGCFGALLVSFLVCFVMGNQGGYGLVGCFISWFMMMFGGLVGVVAGLGSMFLGRRRTLHHGHNHNHDHHSTTVHDDRIYQEAKAGFVQCVRGLFTLLLIPPTLYLIFGMVFVLYHEMYYGWMGIILAMSYPMVRLWMIVIVENSQNIRWGYARGNLCAGVQATLMATSWHAVFLCFYGSYIMTTEELIAVIAVEAMVIVYSLGVIHGIHKIPSITSSTPTATTTTDSNSNEQEEKLPTKARTFEDESREVRVATGIGISSLAGGLFPIVFSLSALFISHGPNRRLIHGLNGMTMYNRNLIHTNESIWDDATVRSKLQGIGSTTMNLLSIYKLFFISISHILFFVFVKNWFHSNDRNVPIDQMENRSVSYDLLALLSALVEYHRNVIVLSAVVSFAALFSVLLSLQMV